jgi:hypothetical protein
MTFILGPIGLQPHDECYYGITLDLQALEERAKLGISRISIIGTRTWSGLNFTTRL